MAADAWILGLVIDGRPRAYGLEALAGHEVVNDSIGDTDFVVVWSPFANVAAVFDRDVGGRTLEFDPADGLLDASLVLRDRQTGSYWSIMSGAAETGELAGAPLTLLPVSDRMIWAEWEARYPDTVVLSAASRPTAAPPPPGGDALAAYFASDEGFRGAVASDSRLDTKSQVYAFVHDGIAYAVDSRRVIGGQSFELPDGTWALVYREAGDGAARASSAYRSPEGFEQRGGSWFELATDAEFNAITRDFGGAGVERLTGFDTFWYTWSLAHPSTELLR
jgi:hypothetical protein